MKFHNAWFSRKLDHVRIKYMLSLTKAVPLSAPLLLKGFAPTTAIVDMTIATRKPDVFVKTAILETTVSLLQHFIFTS